MFLVYSKFYEGLKLGALVGLVWSSATCRLPYGSKGLPSLGSWDSMLDSVSHLWLTEATDRWLKDFSYRSQPFSTLKGDPHPLLLAQRSLHLNYFHHQGTDDNWSLTLCLWKSKCFVQGPTRNMLLPEGPTWLAIHYINKLSVALHILPNLQVKFCRMPM